MSEWHTDMDAAPADTKLEIKAGGMIFGAMLVRDGSLTEDMTACDQWRALREDEHPPCWSDGCWWASNADEVASIQPTAWRYPTHPDREGKGGERP